MLHSTDMTVLERQKARLKWQQEQQILHQQQREGYFGDLSSVFQVQQQQQQQQLGFQGGGGLGEVVTLSTTFSVKPVPGLVDNGWPNFVGFGPSGGYGSGNDGSGLEFDYAAISGTSGCQPMVTEAAAADKGRESVALEKVSTGAGRGSFKKRKVDKVHNNAEVVAEEETRDKRIRGCQEERESKITEKISTKSGDGNSNKGSNNKKTNNSSSSNKENSAETSKDNSKVTEVQKPDYIHVRARRGQATDSHSLAERVRREKISERMKYLQDLVPGCNKIIGKAGMLDEIINYVQSLQRQVEFLSMKLAAVNPRLDFNIDDLFAKEMFPSCAISFPTVGMSSDLTNPAYPYHQFNPVQQPMVTCGLALGTNAPDMGLRRSIRAPVPISEPFLDAFCFTQIQPSSNWDVDLQSLCNVGFDQGRSTFFPSQPFTGPLDAGNLKMEM